MSHDDDAKHGHELTRVMRPMYARQWLLGPAPRHAIPDEGMPPSTAYHLIHDELIIDGSSRFNLATFCGTWMEPEAQQPDVGDVRQEHDRQGRVSADGRARDALRPHAGRVVAFARSRQHAGHLHHRIERSLHARRPGAEVALAREDAQTGEIRGSAEPGPGHQHAGLLAQIRALLGRRGEVRCRWKGIGTVTDPERAAAACDENTIGVVVRAGQHVHRRLRECRGLSAALDRLQEKTGLDIPIHVDGASGAFVAPFIQPDLVWDFQLPRVKSINTSGHKYGLVYPGVGWIVWREASDLHPDLIFNVDYLGGTMPTLAINFSRPASQVVAQYYNLIRLGKSGYRAIHQACQDVAVHLARQIGEMGPFELLSDGRDLAGIRVDAEGADALVAVRSGGPAARSRLAGAGLPHACQPAGSGRAARGGAQRVHQRSGRHAGAGHPPAPGLVCDAARTQSRQWTAWVSITEGEALARLDRAMGQAAARSAV